jgi:hypothetical protein
MQISVRTDGGIKIVDVTGEVDMQGTPQLRDTLGGLTKTPAPKSS